MSFFHLIYQTKPLEFTNVITRDTLCLEVKEGGSR